MYNNNMCHFLFFFDYLAVSYEASHVGFEYQALVVLQLPGQESLSGPQAKKRGSRFHAAV